jgi:tetratricopeptide (TPR) repeat protein
MKMRYVVLAALVLSVVSIYACKSVETTSAVLHNEHGNYAKAIEMANAALAKNPNDAEAHFQLGVSYSYTGDMKGAYREFTLAGQLDPAKRADAETDIKSNWAKHFNSGLSEFQAENQAGAAHEFELATWADPRQVKGWLNLAKVYYTMGLKDSTYLDSAYVDVDTLLAKTQPKDEEYTAVLALSGEVMVRRGMTDKAADIFQKLLADDPSQYETVETSAEALLNRKDWEGGAKLLEMAIDARKKTNSEDFQSYYNLGVAYYNSKNYPKAIEMYTEAATLDPEQKSAQYSLLLAYFQSEQLDDAILTGEKFTQKWPDDPNGWRILGLAYSKKGMNIKAEEAAKKFQQLTQ